MSISPTTATSPASWESLILSERSAADIWTSIFTKLGETAAATPNPTLLHRETIVPDRLLAESAWDLWQAFPTDAPKIVDAMRDFWAAPSASAGTAILI